MTSAPEDVTPPFRVLYEDNHLLAVVKPPGIPTMGAVAGRTSLLDLAKRYLKNKYRKPGNVYLGVVSRLDAPVTGVLILARTSKAAERLTNQFRRREVQKTYWAIVSGHVVPEQGECTDWLRKDEPRRRMSVARPDQAGAKQAELTYQLVRQLPAGSLLEIELGTGRKHQIRVQLAHRGHPVLGDGKYGSRVDFPVGIALLSRRLRLMHPVRQEPLDLVAATPRPWWGFGVHDSQTE